MAEMIFQNRQQQKEQAGGIKQRKAVLQDGRVSTKLGKLGDDRTVQLTSKPNTADHAKAVPSGLTPVIQRWRVSHMDADTGRSVSAENQLHHLSPGQIRDVANRNFTSGVSGHNRQLGRVHVEAADAGEEAQIVAHAQRLVGLANEGATADGIRHVDTPPAIGGPARGLSGAHLAGWLAEHGPRIHAELAGLIPLPRVRRDAESGVRLSRGNVDVHLDNDQLKHQPAGHPIGTRVTHGGTKFSGNATSTGAEGSAAWHIANTLPHMLAWADGLGAMAEGEVRHHAQGPEYNGIHYEGNCMMASGRKHVLFHCYPARK